MTLVEIKNSASNPNPDPVAPTDEPTPAIQEGFESFNLSAKILQGVADAGFTAPSPIQVAAIPMIMEGRDIMALAQTGSGKTAAFVLPLLNKLKFKGAAEILVLVPTRELAQQVADEFERLGRSLRIRAATVVGGKSFANQINLMNGGAQVIVATPGRLIDHLTAKRIRKFEPDVLVLDEADEMLDMGFVESIQEIATFLPKERQTLLFSATMSAGVRNLAHKLLTDPGMVNLTSPKTQHIDIEQRLYVVREQEREDALLRLIESENPEKALIFCRTKQATDELTESLLRRQIRAKAIHGDLPQASRSAAMQSLKTGHIRLLVATDVAARGLDINDLSHVFNFHLPDNRDRYTHRIGRTGRAGKKGVAVTLATPGEVRNHDFFRSSNMENFTIQPIPTRKVLEAKRDETLLAKIEAFDIEDNVRDICRKLYYTDDGFDFACRMFSYIQSLNPIKGPDKVGLGSEEIADLKNRKFPSSSRSNSNSSNSYGGGYRGRSNGGSSQGGYRNDRNSRPRFEDSPRPRYGSDRPSYDDGARSRFGTDRPSMSAKPTGDRPSYQKPSADRPSYTPPPKANGDRPRFDKAGAPRRAPKAEL